ncbi:MAG: hypothetical protein EU981_02665 [Candidatus Liberibacter ctenarytainae]|uniref:Uncharacterized protein n=1 Tax=Candidatus Liberibacter ctenarytainae TaxID=2020335 RepID=A0A937DH09_9HYPH|nr:hypothetical protein [Candidatus Liberibacter ctenarytainae]
MRYSILASILCLAFSSSIGKAQSVYLLHSPVKTQNSFITVPKNTNDPLHRRKILKDENKKVILEQKKEIINGKEFIVTTDNLMNHGPETFVHNFWKEEIGAIDSTATEKPTDNSIEQLNPPKNN